MKKSIMIDLWTILGSPRLDAGNESLAHLNDALVAGVITLETYCEMLRRLMGDPPLSASARA